MRAIRYTKDGRSARLEIENGTRSELSLQERGESVERGKRFDCTTLPGQTAVTPDEVAPIPASLAELLERQGDDLERATIMTGASHHEIEIEGETRTWCDQSVRLHASIINRRHGFRCEIDRGGASFLDHWAAELIELREAVASFDPQIAIASPVVLEPAVSAAVVAALWSMGIGSSGPALVQAPPAGVFDGCGMPVTEEPIVSGQAGSAWFRPSYRVPPRQIPHDIDLATDGTQLDLQQNRAIALAGPIRLSSGVLHVPCLIKKPNRAAGAIVEIDVDRWDEQIEAGSERADSSPLFAGVWGRRMLFKGGVSRLRVSENAVDSPAPLRNARDLGLRTSDSGPSTRSAGRSGR